MLSVLDADHTFVNEALAKHYGIPGVTGPEWRRVDGVRQYGRGGILGLATTLAKQSGASRTSPILRGNWVSEVAARREAAAAAEGRAAAARGRGRHGGPDRAPARREAQPATPRCAVCHARIDPFGFALEGFDAIGRRRDKDLGDRPDRHADASSRTAPSSTASDGLRDYLLTTRRDDVVRQFCRKLLGYALGRGVQLSDEPLLDDMQQQLEEERLPLLRGRRDDRPQPPVPRDPRRPRHLSLQPRPRTRRPGSRTGVNGANRETTATPLAVFDRTLLCVLRVFVVLLFSRPKKGKPQRHKGHEED